MKKGKKVAGKNKSGNSFSTGKAGLAVKHGFYLETIWILSLIFEKKAKGFLRWIESASNLKAYSFEQTIKRIKYHHQGGRVPQLEKHLDMALIEEMRTWKNNRNTMLKDMVSVHVSQRRMERLASEGIVLYKKWNKSLKRVKAEMKSTETLTGTKETSLFSEK